MKRSADFHFKKFSIRHDKSTHKVGTDAVVLGAWVNVDHANRILDVGTGTGIIALMLAQRTPARVKIDAVEILQDDASQAKENAERSPWKEKINVHHTSIQNFPVSEKYDLIVSNPPYFVDSWRPPESKRSTARHTHDLDFEEILRSTVRFLNEDGRLALILPPEEAQRFIALASVHGFFLIRKLALKSRKEKPIERLAMEFTRQAKQSVAEELVLHSEGNDWSEEYKNLARDFYLKI